jgi:hypothetical protein
MAALLFYEKPVPVNADVHRQTRLGSLADGFRFSANTNSIPLAAVEFFDTAREYPIAFTGKEGGPLFPIALIGVRQNENLFVAGTDGRWDARYIPAFVRRYPFVLAEKQDAEDFNVYIDEAYSGFNAKDGERIFTDDGEQTPMFKQALDFLSTYQGEIKRTRLFVEKIQALEILVPRVLEIVRTNQAPMVLQGFSVVDEQKLMSLGDPQLLELARSGYLAWIYAHLMSLGNVSRLSERFDALMKSQEGTGAASAIAESPAAQSPGASSDPPSKKKR